MSEYRRVVTADVARVLRFGLRDCTAIIVLDTSSLRQLSHATWNLSAGCKLGAKSLRQVLHRTIQSITTAFTEGYIGAGNEARTHNLQHGKLAMGYAITYDSITI
jgi:hypothetical protein